MALKSTPFVAGNRRGTIYDFENVGDLLPMPPHDASTDHMTVVAAGSVILRGEGWNDVYKAPAVILDLPSPHEAEALEANGRLVNIIKN